MGRCWIGADPGGKDKDKNNSFGLAFLDTARGVRCYTVCSVDEAVDVVKRVVGSDMPLGLGIDAPMWWSGKPGGSRTADEKVRAAIQGRCKSPSGTAQSPNSLPGVVLIGGAMLALRVRQAFPRPVPVTEAHPKALLYALELDCHGFAKRYRICPAWKNEHERDAAIAAVCAREGFEKRWPTDLAQQRHGSEFDPQDYWLAPVHYFWPEPL